MEIVKYICPNCGTRLKITRSDSAKTMEVTCPVCRNNFTARFDVPPPLPPGGGYESTGTMIVQNRNKRAINSCTLNCNGRIYPLSKGRNSIGRAPSANANMGMGPQPSVAIPTFDRTMSRLHAYINVRDDKVTISKVPGTDQAILIVDGVRLYPADAIQLLPGSVIIMGKTQMICAMT